MQSDFSVELGAEDPVLDVPWATPDGRQRYYDLKRQPDLMPQVEEAAREPALREFLAAVNARASCLESVKCDAWFTRELGEDEAIFGASAKFGSYVDLIFADDAARYSFGRHEELARRLVTLLNKAPEIPAAVEFIIRRCFYAAEAAPANAQNAPAEGFYLTCYCFGYADDEPASRKYWTIALKLVENAVRQVSGEVHRLDNGSGPQAG